MSYRLAAVAEPTSQPGRRERNRIERTRIFLDTALDIVTTEGFDALTMQRLADDCDAAIGAVYRYFPSKGSLVAEVQREAIERLATSYALARDRGDHAFLAANLKGQDLALARLMLVGRWFIATADTFPQELRLLQMLMSEWRPVVPIEEGMRVVPTAMRLLDHARVAIADSVEAGVIDDRTDAMSRVIIWAAAVSGVLNTGRLDVYDPELFDGPRLAKTLTLDLFASWGAERAAVDAAASTIDALAASGPLAGS